MDYVLVQFGKKKSAAREKYVAFVQDGVGKGREQDLSGGGLVRSVGGWQELSALRRKNIRPHNDERILGDSDFVATVLKEAGVSHAQRAQCNGEKTSRIHMVIHGRKSGKV